LTKQHLDGVDIQSVPFPLDFFSEQVEDAMRQMELREADFVRLDQCQNLSNNKVIPILSHNNIYIQMLFFLFVI